MGVVKSPLSASGKIPVFLAVLKRIFSSMLFSIVVIGLLIVSLVSFHSPAASFSQSFKYTVIMSEGASDWNASNGESKKKRMSNN